tara:strand:+ start:209 stop:454 length:246 start_codon:yes stop_codon:yes gene_type:complete
MKAYFKGCSGIKNPVDFKGHEIKVGDQLSYDYRDCADIKAWMKKPAYKVQEHKSGGLFATGMNNELYLHDFRFEYCEIINT